MICGTPPGLHHKKVQPFANIAQFPPAKKNTHTHTHTQRETPLDQSNVGLDQGLRGMCDLKGDRPKNAKTFCKTFVHDCIILPDREPTDILPRQVPLCTHSYMQHILQTHSVQVTSIHTVQNTYTSNETGNTSLIFWRGHFLSAWLVTL